MEEASRHIDAHLLKKSLFYTDTECGDTGIIIYDNQFCFFSLIDAVGHGQEAYRIASMAQQYLENNHMMDLVSLMHGMHHLLKGTRGAVAAICRLNTSNGLLQYLSIGNITLRVIGADTNHLSSGNGIIGYMISTPHEKTCYIQPGELLFLHSDGIKDHMRLSDIGVSHSDTAKNIAVNIMEKGGKENDDKSCIILKFESYATGESDHYR